MTNSIEIMIDRPPFIPIKVVNGSNTTGVTVRMVVLRLFAVMVHVGGIVMVMMIMCVLNTAVQPAPMGMAIPTTRDRYSHHLYPIFL